MAHLKLGMVGGGQGAFIGGVHRMAARLDGCFDLVAGAFSSDPARAHAFAAELGIADYRSYSDYNEMAKAEAARSDGIDAVSIVTPNHLHGPIAEAFLAHDISVICDKPMTATLAQAESLVEAAKSSKGHFFLTHNYTGYPLIRQARQMVADGALGDIRIVEANYLQDWLSEAPAEDNKQAKWRMDPAQSGGGAIGDIGTHAHNLACFVTGLHVTSLSATLSSNVAGRLVDDDARITLQFEGGARGHVWASQVAIGNENNLTLAVYGTKGSLRWVQENPNVLWFAELGTAPQMITRASGAASPAATAVTRIPAGHPEGYLEAFATLYREAADAITNQNLSGATLGAQEGLDGVRFVDACQRSSRDKATWIDLP
ncbi:Gfo/Idh/MocA family oxidoreductase [Octadecabacter sp. 1_MG-2023]|uniref:Gfo/Idh/MocA family protein n=1 Tax=unclassified Octadecabacter TaxID=196158 RepID=UPI001C099138|nr:MULTISPECIES: Gfo/Idh/MocA family oxidoreductase [unclassified Octadecabacter]MBU2994786.1 Gfo/Idh/MocA family oxidoreductase [Octadecabacter sp. B2R22]MDO6733920.1 Gfo/Idh/MocA family oxidoreductase [Octadecabacter sp. 1_MG-2023]